MKKIFVLFNILFLFSCYSNKEILQPKIIFNVYDSTTKLPLEDVALYTTTQKDSILTYLKEYPIKSNKKGSIILKEESRILKGNIRATMPPMNFVFLFKKNGYKETKLEMFKIFKLSEYPNYNTTYHSDSIFLNKLTP
ncbi:hypothetical protein ETU09_06190 [Apibacter muscae]|uniref:Lipoprotein n=1 Tax=Apibacter muscae TaxID=2509004 RepID=A0A563DDP2_9FLAO|nr:hypothetical protein [Apibacter muscae]TWP28325.1 hypothetical protein ETU09_06190 [Apibacter muscae]